MIRRALRAVVWTFIWLVALGCATWAFGALHYDFPVAKAAIAWVFAGALVAAIVFLHGSAKKLGAVFLVFALVLAWWLTLKPSNDGNWQPDVAQMAWAEINDDEVTFHNVRNCDYRTATDYTPHWETRTVRLSEITGIDLAIDYWGSRWIAHPIVSFQFADALPLCFSIEIRKTFGQSYSTIGGLYRQYALIYVVSDERDVIRLRTNYRNENIYLYHTIAPPDRARERFLEYVNTLNALRTHPRWYNAITTNCTTAIRDQRPTSERVPWDWRILLNGKADELLYERGDLVTGGLPFAELKQRSLIDERAKAADKYPDFSARIREGLPQRASFSGETRHRSHFNSQRRAGISGIRAALSNALPVATM